MHCAASASALASDSALLPRYSGSVSGGLSFLTIQACAVSAVPQLPRRTARKHSGHFICACLTANGALPARRCEAT